MPGCTSPPLEIVEVPESAAAVPHWKWGTIMYHDDDGQLVGCGYFSRVGNGTAAELAVTFDPSSVAVLAPSLLEGDS
jgi:hypothetical protein